MKNSFSKRTLWGGWIVFAISLITYLLTIEPTNSLWDCSEFIATSYKLEVGHPPGTPFFFLINRFAAMFAPGTTSVAMVINAMSALESALTIAFLFWSIAHLGRRIYRKSETELTDAQSWAIVGAAAIGSLAYAFSDTFWFSAVEAEVYALSSLFTAVVFWAILKWENVADEPGSNRWLILIAYLMGLSIGAHILNLLAIPALVFIYYFKKYPARPKRDLWKPGVLSVVILGAFYILTPTVVSIGAWVDRIFVNSFGLGINSGLVCFMILLLGLLGWGIYKSDRAGRVTLNTILLSALMVVIGFSTYGVVLIRASVNPPMNSNHPSNPYALLSFLNREQYGTRPLVNGASYASIPIETIYKDGYYVKDGEYVPYTAPSNLKYDPATTMFFPRMYSPDERHIGEYKRWANITGKKVKTSYGETITVPTFGENMRFFFAYQLNNMYWRYFLWNFVGRQSDLQNNGITDGNWLSGITPLDELYLGPQSNLPSEMANNRGRNTYFFLPFILGLVGFFFQLKRDGRNFLVVFLLFFMTGLAIILYLNQTPFQPRERDYAYAGSFYAFAIWIGLGLMGLFDLLSKRVRNGRVAAATAFVLCASVPAVLAVQNWDDHDRSGRTIARDMGHNYLNSVLPNGIIIDYGDNDTFPLWYAQEVEGVRPDVRVMNASYITGDWYIDQMRVRSNESAPLPIRLPRSKYNVESSGRFPVQEVPKQGGWTLREVMDIIYSDDPRTKLSSQDGAQYDFIPACRIALPVNKEAVVRSGVVRPEDAHLIEDTIYLNLKKKSYNPGELVLLDILANNDWERPLHFTSAVELMNIGLVEYSDKEAWSYLQQDGGAYRLVPIKSPIERAYGVGRVDTETLYDNLMNKFSYGNISDPKVYVDAFVSNTMGASQFRSSFARLADALSAQGDTLRAVEVVDRAMAEMPLSKLRYDDMVPSLIEAYYTAGATDKGDALAEESIDLMLEYINYFGSLKGRYADATRADFQDRLQSLYLLYGVVGRNNRTELIEIVEPYFSR